MKTPSHTVRIKPIGCIMLETESGSIHEEEDILQIIKVKNDNATIVTSYIG